MLNLWISKNAAKRAFSCKNQLRYSRERAFQCLGYGSVLVTNDVLFQSLLRLIYNPASDSLCEPRETQRRVARVAGIRPTAANAKRPPKRHCCKSAAAAKAAQTKSGNNDTTVCAIAFTKMRKEVMFLASFTTRRSRKPRKAVRDPEFCIDLMNAPSARQEVRSTRNSSCQAELQLIF